MLGYAIWMLSPFETEGREYSRLILSDRKCCSFDLSRTMCVCAIVMECLCGTYTNVRRTQNFFISLQLLAHWFRVDLTYTQTHTICTRRNQTVQSVVCGRFCSQTSPNQLLRLKVNLNFVRLPSPRIRTPRRTPFPLPLPHANHTHTYDANLERSRTCVTRVKSFGEIRIRRLKRVKNGRIFCEIIFCVSCTYSTTFIYCRQSLWFPLFSRTPFLLITSAHTNMNILTWRYWCWCRRPSDVTSTLMCCVIERKSNNSGRNSLCPFIFKKRFHFHQRKRHTHACWCRCPKRRMFPAGVSNWQRWMRTMKKDKGGWRIEECAVANK